MGRRIRRNETENDPEHRQNVLGSKTSPKTEKESSEDTEKTLLETGLTGDSGLLDSQSHSQVEILRFDSFVAQAPWSVFRNCHFLLSKLFRRDSLADDSARCLKALRCL